MVKPGTFRTGRPASILIAIVVLTISYWLGLAPSDLFERPNSSDGKPVATSDATAEHRETVPRQGVSPYSQPDREGVLPREVQSQRADPIESVGLRYGLLREISGGAYLSPAGLIYGPGSAEGHRLDHLRRHTKDDPGRGGSHGVFDGGMAGALKTVDLAYERATTGQRTTTKVDEDRTIHTVDLGKRVGFVGGSEGRRRGHPMARRVRLVLEGKRVVTAFPM